MTKCCLDALCRRTSRDVKNLEFLLDLTVCRLSHLRRQGKTRCAEAEDDVAEHLRRGHRDRALIPAETVIKERNMLDGFDIVESYCHLLKKPAFLDHKQKECPEELREAAAGLAYAALRCGDLPELRKIRRIFRSRFGREFTTAVAELRDNCGVGADPSLATKHNVMREIAIEKGIDVDLAKIPVETVENPNLQRRTQQARATLGRLCAACLREPLEGKMYEDAGSTTLAASESAAAARTDVELYRSESERIRDHSSNPHNQKPESSRGKEIQNENDESSDSDEARLQGTGAGEQSSELCRTERDGFERQNEPARL
ncbi:uncharacterized protein LOC110029196 isoform X3 [Phalaenopsis equestris]|uniref:uncharacterized protein LOC110029196 isoform X3 n=1 Tax=Phalaenopsis equestris TaxID=78828 RepID=UPI0009E1E5E9|nr:uncharacterized protein LOC110029196 isoform X3 [Phalaenopsis equestris]